MLIVTGYLNSCTRINCNINTLPIYPVAGEQVAKELEKLDETEFSKTWEWLGRIDKLRQELEMYQQIN